MKRQLLLLLNLLYVSVTFTVLSASNKNWQGKSELDMSSKYCEISFRGFYADEQPNGIFNPERGFRLTDDIDVEAGRAMWDNEGKTTLTSNLFQKVKDRNADSVSLVTCYFYIHKYIDKRLDEQAFVTINDFLNTIRMLGKKAIVRFAYELGYGDPGPTEDRILEHIQQLKPLINANKDVIYIMQAGFVGCWGEWHDSKYKHERNDKVAANILSHIVDMLPKGRYTQMRYPPFRELLKNDDERYERIGLHDDFIILDSESGGAAEMYEGGKWFSYMNEWSYNLPVDGELPPFKDWPQVLSGCRVARQLFLGHYSSLSAQTRYEENLVPWKKEVIEPSYLKANHMPYVESYFKTMRGEIVQRSAFDYIRDHLGYRLELQKLWIKKRDRYSLDLSLSLINRGFARIYNEHPIYYVLIDKQGKVYDFETQADAHTFYPHNKADGLYVPLIHKIHGCISIKKLPKGEYSLGLWIPDGDERLRYDRRYAIRCANGGNMNWWISPDERYGINVLTTITLK